MNPRTLLSLCLELTAESVDEENLGEINIPDDLKDMIRERIAFVTTMWSASMSYSDYVSWSLPVLSIKMFGLWKMLSPLTPDLDPKNKKYFVILERPEEETRRGECLLMDSDPTFMVKLLSLIMDMAEDEDLLTNLDKKIGRRPWLDKEIGSGNLLICHKATTLSSMTPF